MGYSWGGSYKVDSPAKDKSELVAALGIAINELILFLNNVDIDLNKIVSASADAFAKLIIIWIMPVKYCLIPRIKKSLHLL